MSADNGIYIAQFKDGFRVIHAQAVDNLYYFPEGSQEEKDEWKLYFENGKLFKTKGAASLYAHNLEDNGKEYMEYGVSYLGKGVEWEEDVSEGHDKAELYGKGEHY